MKKLLLILICFALLFSAASCRRVNVLHNNEFHRAEDGVGITPHFAFYNQGRRVAQLEDIDPEAAQTVPPNDGGLVVYWAVTNSSRFAKRIVGITVEYLRDSDGRDIVTRTTFTIDSDVYLTYDRHVIIPTEFEQEQVLRNSRLSNLTFNATVHMEGAVVDGAPAPEADSGFTASVTEAKFNESDALIGSISIRNNYDTARTPQSITFTLVTETGASVTLAPQVVELGTEIGASEALSVRFAVNPANVDADIRARKAFDNIEINFEIE